MNLNQIERVIAHPMRSAIWGALWVKPMNVSEIQKTVKYFDPYEMKEKNMSYGSVIAQLKVLEENEFVIFKGAKGKKGMQKVFYPSFKPYMLLGLFKKGLSEEEIKNIPPTLFNLMDELMTHPKTMKVLRKELHIDEIEKIESLFEKQRLFYVYLSNLDLDKVFNNLEKDNDIKPIIEAIESIKTPEKKS